jgi:endonuclease/exonuclease/phosphatase family metal-dependent hydrolase
VSLHAEANLAGQSLSGLRALQMMELVGTLGTDPRVIMLGDFNDAPGSPMYQVLQGAGFTDVWRAMRPGVVGNTCCHADDLSDNVADLSQRIDYVFTRGIGSADKLFGKIDRYGEVPSDRVAGPAYAIWPSDHVGLIATVR